MRKIAILGSTGSIGTQALSVCALHPDEFQVEALVCSRSKDLLFEQARTFHPRMCGLSVPIPMSDIPDDLRHIDWVMGEEALQAAACSDADDVLVSVVGMIGLSSVLTALRHHKRVLLANKEALVAGGQLVMDAAAREGEFSLLPVDSEHSAIYQCLRAADGNPLSRIALTCSGGPFRTWDKDAIRRATKEQALKHPTWVMGQKITTDSATLFNKALEMMEAKWLFRTDADQIDVLIHPQSVIHSGVEFCDGALLCQLGTPDMRIPILYAMSFPRRMPTGGQRLSLTDIGTLTFEKPDEERFPSLRMMRECMRAGGAAGCVLNAANEEAVYHFLATPGATVGGIYDTVEETLQRCGTLSADTLEDVLYADRLARDTARQIMKK